MWELRHQALLTDVLANLNRVGITPVLFKGTALAYSLYPEPAWRTRGDTDFIIPPHSLSLVHEVLGALGFVPDLAVSGEVISYQASYTWARPGQGEHTLDVHWRINNSEVLAQLFSYEELRAQARPLPALAPHAYGAGPVHALLLACMHRATHRHNPYYVDGVAHYEADRLIWLYDIHLLLGAFTAADVEAFVAAAREKGLCAVCREAIERTVECFHTALPAGLMDALVVTGPQERPARYLTAGLLQQKWMDFVALGSTRRRLQFLRELLFPSASYMRAKFPDHAHGWLGWLYLVRAVRGLSNRMRRSD